MTDFRKDLYERYHSTFKKHYLKISEKSKKSEYAYYRSKFLPLISGYNTNASILDLGCGQGLLMEFLIKSGYTNLQGVDISEEQIAIAKESGLSVTVADAFAFLNGSKKFDIIFALDFVEHFHKDELIMSLGNFAIKKEGSQGQNKTYLIALKLAQFDFLKRMGNKTPLLLLDDIFDKLDASRVEQIVKLVAGESFGQIFITDTNREHLDRIMRKMASNYKIFEVSNGVVSDKKEVE